MKRDRLGMLGKRKKQSSGSIYAIFIMFSLLTLMFSACQKTKKQGFTLPKGKYNLWDDKPFTYRPCQAQADTNQPKIMLFETKKDSLLPAFSYLIDDSLAFAHLPAMNGWLQIPIPFPTEQLNYLKYLFPIDRPRHECAVWDIYPFEDENSLYFIHSVYNQNTQAASRRYYLINLSDKNFQEIDMKQYKMCSMEEKKCLVCEQVNGESIKINPLP
ncbi:MAG: hypothetical protein ACKVTZ_22975 [Bacteroidia bacterium]